MLKSICEAMGNRILAFCAASGKLTLLLLATLRRLKDANAKEVVRQMALLGADSLPIVMMTILCTGMVFSVQTAKEFVRLGAYSSVGGIVAIAMARELVPVLTGVVVGAGANKQNCCRPYRCNDCGGAWHDEGYRAD